MRVSDESPYEDLTIEPCFQGFLYIESLDAKPKYAETVIEARLPLLAPKNEKQRRPRFATREPSFAITP